MPPKSILVYAANTATDQYTITHLNSGGDNADYFIKGLTFSAFDGGSGNENQYDGDLFTLFGANGIIEIDMVKANFDWNRQGFPSAKETHLYVVFLFYFKCYTR